MGRSGEGMVTVAHLHAGTGERPGHVALRISLKYPATGQQGGQANLKGTVAP